MEKRWQRKRRDQIFFFFSFTNLWIWQPMFCLIRTKERRPGRRDHHFSKVKLLSLHHTSVHSPLPRSLWPPRPQIFWLITPNVILIKNGGVKGFSLPEKRVQIAAQWQTPSLAWEEMHPDIVSMMPNDQSQIKKRHLGRCKCITFMHVDEWSK